MRVLIAFDKFKDSMPARRACKVAAQALRSARPEWELDLCPLTDGGDGFSEILTAAAGGTTTNFQVAGPRGRLVEAPIGLVPAAKIPADARGLLGVEGAPVRNGTVAIVEMASASGLALLPSELRDPWKTTSQGTGQLIRAAAELGAAAVLLGVGGSATNDLGLGALGALGYEFRSADGSKLRPATPARWASLASVDGDLYPSIPPIFIACDVTNPLLGPRGAAATFGPQKGLKPDDLERIEAQGARVAALLCSHCGRPLSLAEAPGAGAAGGIAFGLMAAARATLLPGAALVSACLGLEAKLASADLVITGEGRYDASSAGGKGPGALAVRALELKKPVHVFAGRIDAAGSGAALHAITPDGTPLSLALRQGPDRLAQAVSEVFKSS